MRDDGYQGGFGFAMGSAFGPLYHGPGELNVDGEGEPLMVANAR